MWIQFLYQENNTVPHIYNEIWKATLKRVICSSFCLCVMDICNIEFSKSSCFIYHFLILPLFKCNNCFICILINYIHVHLTFQVPIPGRQHRIVRDGDHQRTVCEETAHGRVSKEPDQVNDVYLRIWGSETSGSTET